MPKSKKRTSKTKRTSKIRSKARSKVKSRKRSQVRSKVKSKKKKSKTKVRIPVSRGGLFGYHIDLPAKKRRSLLKRLMSKGVATYSEIIKRLNVLVIYNKRRHPETSEKVKRDMEFVHRHFAKYSLTLQNTQHKPRRSKKRSKRRKSQRGGRKTFC